MFSRVRWFTVLLILSFAWLPPGNVAARVKTDTIISNQWVNTGSMHDPRTEFTLTLLPDGKALAAGGFYNNGTDHYLSSSETYDLLSGVWSLAGSMNSVRRRHTATPLLDGRVLVAGGMTALGSLNSAEIYNPVTRTWSLTGNMANSRYSHTATRLTDGRVLVVGGCQSILTCLTSAEIYDPATGLWQDAAPITEARRSHIAVLLSDGSVLVSGGVYAVGSSPTYWRSAYRYQPASNTWSSAGSMVEQRTQHSAVLQRDGKVMVVGGYFTPSGSLQTHSATTEIFDPATNQWGLLKDSNGDDTVIAFGKSQMMGVMDPLGNYFIIGGGDSTSDNGVQYRDTRSSTDIWHDHGAMSRYRANGGAVLLPNGAILVAGGENTGGSLAEAEINQTWSGSTEYYPESSFLGTIYSAGTTLTNGDILFTGGLSEYQQGANQPCHNQAYVWLNESETVDAIAPMKRERCMHTTTLLPDGRVVVIGGMVAGPAGSAAGAGEILSGGVWTTLTGPSFPAPKTALLPNGEILIVDPATRPHAYLFKPQDLTFRQTTGEYDGTYNGFTLTLMNNGKVLILGSTIANITEVYDPQTETFSQIPSISTESRLTHTATLMPDGKVLIAGGMYGSGANQGQPIAATYLFNPDVPPPTNPWTQLDTMISARYFHSAVLLTDGRVAVLGGQLNATGESIDTVELYDPVENSWHAAGEMLEDRAVHKTLLSPKGKILTFGGYGDSVSGHFLARMTVEQFIFTNTSPSIYFWRPTLTGARCVDCPNNRQIQVTGSNFSGQAESTTGTTAQSATNTPLVKIMRLDNQQSLWLTPGAATSNTTYLSAPIPDFPDGPVMVYVFMNGSMQGQVLLLNSFSHTVYLPVVIR